MGSRQPPGHRRSCVHAGPPAHQPVSRIPLPVLLPYLLPYSARRDPDPFRSPRPRIFSHRCSGGAPLGDLPRNLLSGRRGADRARSGRPARAPVRDFRGRVRHSAAPGPRALFRGPRPTAGFDPATVERGWVDVEPGVSCPHFLRRLLLGPARPRRPDRIPPGPAVPAKERDGARGRGAVGSLPRLHGGVQRLRGARGRRDPGDPTRRRSHPRPRRRLPSRQGGPPTQRVGGRPRSSSAGPS